MSTPNSSSNEANKNSQDGTDHNNDRSLLTEHFSVPTLNQAGVPITVATIIVVVILLILLPVLVTLLGFETALPDYITNYSEFSFEEQFEEQ